MSFLTRAVTAAREVSGSVGGIKEYTKKLAALEKDDQQIEKERLRAEENSERKVATKKKKGLGAKVLSDPESTEGESASSFGATRTTPQSPMVDPALTETPLDHAVGQAQGWDSLDMMEPAEIQIAVPAEIPATVPECTVEEQMIASEPSLPNSDAGLLRGAMVAIAGVCGIEKQDFAAMSEAVLKYVQELKELNTVSVQQVERVGLQLKELQTAVDEGETRSAELAQQLQKFREAEELRERANAQEKTAGLKEFEDKAHALEGLLLEAQRKEASMQAEAQAMQEQMERLRSSLKASEEDAAKWKSVLEDRTVQLERLSKRLGEAMEAQSGVDDLLHVVRGTSDTLLHTLAQRCTSVQTLKHAVQQQEKDCASALNLQEQQVEQLKITLKGDAGKGAKAKFRSEIIAILQRRLAAFKVEVAALQKQNETLGKRLEAVQNSNPLLQGVALAYDGKGEGPAKDDKLWVILSQLESLGQFLDNVSFSLSEKRNVVQSDCAKCEAQEKESAKWLADTKVSLVATAEEGQRSAPKSQILSMLKQRLADLRADNARQVERWTAAEQRLMELQEVLRKADAEREALQLQHLEAQQTMADQLLNAPEALKCKQQLQETQLRVEDLTRQLQAKDLELQEAQLSLKAVTRELEECRQQNIATTTDVAAKYHALQVEFRDLQQEAQYHREHADLARSELRTKCDQAVELQEQNEALLSELLALKEEQQRRVQSMTQAVQEERTAAVAKHRQEMLKIRQDFEKQLAQMQVEFRACQQSEATVQQRLQEMCQQLEEKEQAIKELQLKIENLQKAKPAPPPDTGSLSARQKEAHLKAFEQEMIGMAQRESSRSYEKRGIYDEGKRADPNQQYLRNVVLQYLCAKDQEIRGGLIPVLSTVLQFSPEEMQSVWKAHRQWRW